MTHRDESTVKQANEARLARVESLRALAAIGVVATHSFGATVGQWFQGLDHRLAGGVGSGGYFFFALSGCLLYIPYARRDFGEGGSVSLGRYALNRAVRVFPLYYLSVVTCLIVFQHGGTLSQWATWGLFLENFKPQDLASVNGVMWTIVIELHFYLLLPLIAWLIARLSKGSLRRGALVLLALTLASWTLRFTYVDLPDREWLNPLRMSLPSLFYLIGAGMLVALLREAWLQKRPTWLRGSLAAADLWLLAAIPFWFATVVDYHVETLLAVASFLLLGAAVLPLERGTLVRALDWRPLALLGLTSYSIYIWHVPIIRFVVHHNVPLIDPAIGHAQELVGSDFVGMALVIVPLACAVAAVSYLLVEAPALRLRKRWGDWRRQSVTVREPPRPLDSTGSADRAPASELA